MSISFINRKSGGGGGDGSSLNVFAQLTEPTIKKGIWLQAEKAIQHIIYDENVFIGGTWELDGKYADAPVDTTSCPIISIGSDIYIFIGIANGNGSRYAYKYDTLTNTYTRLSDVPYEPYGSQITAVGTDIYMFGSANYTSSIYYRFEQYCYKYDTLTDTYTRMADLIDEFRVRGFAVSVGTDIYYGGCSLYNNRFYKYDTLNNTHTQLSDLPTSADTTSAVSLGTNIYMYSADNLYKYDTLTSTFTNLSSCNYPRTGSSIALADNCIYRFGGGSTSAYTQKACKYNILTDVWSDITDTPYACTSSSAVTSLNKIFLIGGMQYPKKVQVYSLETKTYQQDNLVVISQGKYNNVGYETELYSNTKNETSPMYAFADAWFYTTQDGLITDIPTYYGDGTQWINIKNPPST